MQAEGNSVEGQVKVEEVMPVAIRPEVLVLTTQQALEVEK